MTTTKPRPKRTYRRVKPLPPLSPRVLQAVELRHEGLTFREIAKRMGVSLARVGQLLNKAGMKRDRPTDEQVFASIRKAQACGLIRRDTIIAQVCAELDIPRTRAGRLVTRLAGRAAQYIPPPGTPEEWRWCAKCEAFAPPSRNRTSFCKAHYNEYMRVTSYAARRAAGGPSRDEFLVARRAQSEARNRERVASVAHLNAKEGAALLGISLCYVYALRKKYGPSGLRKGL